MTAISRLVVASPETVYRACTDLDTIVRWRMPPTMSGKIDSVDGATYRMSLTYPDGHADTFEATFVERLVNERIVERIRFDAADRPGEMTMTTSLRAVDGGTEVSIHYDGLPSSIRPADNEEGTRQALAKLAELVEVRASIDRRLADIDREFSVEIFYACESGSRAWDFASPDSDYDVRFLYRHPRDWYLSLSEQRDVVETPIDGIYDVNGWDLRRQRMGPAQGTAARAEWQSRPVRMAFLADSLPRTTTRRGLSRSYLMGEAVRQKKYFYVVRPLLACQYLLAHRGIVPMRFFDLVDAVAPPVALREALVDLLKAKRQTSESVTGNRLPVLDQWVDRTFGELETVVPEPSAPADPAPLERFFRTALEGC